MLLVVKIPHLAWKFSFQNIICISALSATSYLYFISCGKTCSCCPFLYVYLHWVGGWISSRRSRRSRSRAAWGCPRSRGTSRPSRAPPAGQGSTARTSAQAKTTVASFLFELEWIAQPWLIPKKKTSCFNHKQWRPFCTFSISEWFSTCPFGSWVSSGKLLCIRWCMWSRMSISDQESCNSFIWSSTWTNKQTSATEFSVSHQDFRFDLTNRSGQIVLCTGYIIWREQFSGHWMS